MAVYIYIKYVVAIRRLLDLWGIYFYAFRLENMCSAEFSQVKICGIIKGLFYLDYDDVGHNLQNP